MREQCFLHASDALREAHVLAHACSNALAVALWYDHILFGFLCISVVAEEGLLLSFHNTLFRTRGAYRRLPEREAQGSQGIFSYHYERPA